VALYEPHARFVRRDRTIAIGSAEIRVALRGLVTDSVALEMQIVRVIGGADLAVLYNDWTMKTTRSDGQVETSEGKAIEVVRRQLDGRWLFARDDPFGRC
jgi:ketosteroid isomerase-like protein